MFPNFRLAISLLDRSLQEEIKKGTIRPVKAEDLMVSAISLNIFVFVANPLIQLFVEEKVKNIINIWNAENKKM